MSARAITSPNARFKLEVQDRSGTYLCTLPYRNIQAEMQLNEKGAALRCEIPYRDWPNITPATLFSGKHELRLIDTQDDLVFFTGPIWDATVSSGTGVISLAAQDKTSYLPKRVLKTGKYYTNTQPVDMLVDLMAYTNGLKSTGMTVSKQRSNAQLVSARFNGADRLVFSDLFKEIQAMGDGVEYFARDGILYLFGGKIVPAAIQPRGIAYGGDIASYSLQFNGSTLTNDHDNVGSNGLIGNATDAAAQAAYKGLFQTVSTGSSATSTAQLNAGAATEIKGKSTTMTIATITSKTLLPIRDFDFGSQFTVVIDDLYAQYNDLIRITGWQLTIGQGDQYTSVLYTKDLSEVA